MAVKIDLLSPCSFLCYSTENDKNWPLGSKCDTRESQVLVYWSKYMNNLFIVTAEHFQFKGKQKGLIQEQERVNASKETVT